MKTMLLILLALFASCAVLDAQETKQGDSTPAKASDHQAQKPAQKSAAKASPTPELQDAIATTPAASGSPSLLKDAGPSSIEDATRKAAHDLATAGQSGSKAETGGPAKDSQGARKDAPASAPSEIGEFQPVAAGTSRTSANPVVQKDTSPGKRVHGEIYGAGSSLGRAGNESVGATSKGGKTSVYVESDQAASTGAPQH